MMSCFYSVVNAGEIDYMGKCFIVSKTEIVLINSVEDMDSVCFEHLYLVGG